MKKLFELLTNYRVATLLTAAVREAKRVVWRQGVRNSFAQDYEDIEIEKLSQGKKGRYLEIGAYHPIRLSNTYRLYKKGWQGTVVEPNPDVLEVFSAYRPKDRFISAGVGPKNAVLKYYKFLIPALNTFSKQEADKNCQDGHKLTGIEKVKVMAVDEIVNGRLDLLSIDTEGMDYEILQSWPWAKTIPEIICAETDKDGKIEELLITKKYRKVFQNKFNSIFVWQK